MCYYFQKSRFVLSLQSNLLNKLLNPYDIVVPQIDSGSTFYFTTDSDLKYEVKFGRKTANIFHVYIVFGVLNEEFEENEYALTNRGEVYRVMATLVEIIRYYMERHQNVTQLEFTGEPTNNESDQYGDKRLRLYRRYLKEIFDENQWKTIRSEGSLVVEKIKFD